MKTANLTLETAKAMYLQGGAAKLFALDNYSEHELTKPEFDENAFIDAIFSDFNYKVDRVKYPDVAFFGFDKEGNYLFEYNEKSKYFWFKYDRIWAVLQEEKRWDSRQTRVFLGGKVEQHFKLNGVTPLKHITPLNEMVEQHFKLNGVTPLKHITPLNEMVEQHFKLNGVTPSV